MPIKSIPTVLLFVILLSASEKSYAFFFFRRLRLRIACRKLRKKATGLFENSGDVSCEHCGFRRASRPRDRLQTGPIFFSSCSASKSNQTVSFEVSKDSSFSTQCVKENDCVTFKFNGDEKALDCFVSNTEIDRNFQFCDCTLGNSVPYPFPGPGSYTNSCDE